MIDNNGRLFGKVNLIDLIIILILVALVVFAIFKFAVPSNKDSAASQVNLTLFCEETPTYVTDYLEVGAPVLDSVENKTLGNIKSFDIGDPIGFETGEDGVAHEIARENYNSVSIKLEAEGEIGENGVTINGILYGVGHTLTVYAGQAKLFLRVSGIEAA